MKGTLSILDATGHSELPWDTDDEGSVAVAERTFTDLLEKGASAFATWPDQPDKPSKRLYRFDKEAEEIVFVKQYVGG